VVVIHQPRVEVAAMFDHLLMLTALPGRVVYNGPFNGHGGVAGVAEYFTRAGRASHRVPCAPQPDCLLMVYQCTRTQITRVLPSLCFEAAGRRAQKGRIAAEKGSS